MTVPPRTREGALAALMAEVNEEKAASLGRAETVESGRAAETFRSAPSAEARREAA